MFTIQRRERVPRHVEDLFGDIQYASDEEVGPILEKKYFLATEEMIYSSVLIYLESSGGYRRVIHPYHHILQLGYIYKIS